MVPRRLLLSGASILALMGIAIAVSGHSQDRWFAPVAILLVLVLPGYSISVALLPDLQGTVRTLVSLGLSLIVAVLGGLLLNILPWGLRPLPWAVWLGSITLASSIVAFVRDQGATVMPELRWPGLTVTSVAGLAAATVLLGLSFQAAVSGESQADTHFTQLWAIPLHTGQQDTLEIGVRNEESATLSYRVTVKDNVGNILTTWDLPNLKQSEQRTEHMAIAIQPSTTQLNVMLVRLDSPNEIYRTVEISTDSFSASSAPR